MSLIRKVIGSTPLSLPASPAVRLRSPDENVVEDARATLQAMTPEVLLQEARMAELTLTATSTGSLRIRGPEGTEELARLVLTRKAEVLPLLRTASAPSNSEPPAPRTDEATPTQSERTASLLADCATKESAVTTGGNNLFVTPRALPMNTDDDKIRRHKAELLESSSADLAKSVFVVEPTELTPESQRKQWEAHQQINAEWALNQPRPWLDAEADAEHQKVAAVLATAEAAVWLSRSQHNLVTVFRQQVQGYWDQRDRQLFGAAAWIQGHVGRWRAEHEVSILRK